MTLTDRAGPGCDTTDGAGDLGGHSLTGRDLGVTLTDGAGDLGVTLTDRAGPGCDTH